MSAILHKTKQYLPAALKVFAVAAAFGVIYWRIHNEVDHHEALALEFTATENNKLFYFLPVFFAFAVANWYFEILKWRLLVSHFKIISIKKATQQCLAALTISLATPNRIGDYGAKALFYERTFRKKILLLNFFSNMAQLAVTVFFGVIGGIFLLQKVTLEFSMQKLFLIIAAVILITIFAIQFKKKQLLIKGLSLEKVIHFYKKMPKILLWKTVIYSVIRYFIFSSLFYVLIRYFGAEISILEGFTVIFSTYLFTSIVPSLFIFDVVIKGGVAVWLFSFFGISETAVIYAVLMMWLLNVVLPALCGGVFIITSKTEA